MSDDTAGVHLAGSVPTPTLAEMDKAHSNLIRSRMNDLNDAILRAQKTGMTVNLGLSRYSDDPAYTLVHFVQIERDQSAA